MLGKSEEAAEGTKSIVSTILGYHTMLLKLPNASDVNARKQLTKDLNRTIKARHCKIPETGDGEDRRSSGEAQVVRGNTPTTANASNNERR